MKMELLSIAICTYDRLDILKKCLKHLILAIEDINHSLEIRIIDNAKQPTVKAYIDSLDINCDIFYHECTALGHAASGNIAAEVCKGEYICFLDDDTFIEKDTILKVIQTIEKYDFEIFGGAYLPFYLEKKPKWIAEDFGASKFKQTYVGYTTEHLVFLIFVVKRSVFKILKFDERYGPKAKKTGYGDETNFQLRAEKLGIKVGFNPQIVVKHLVEKRKHKLLWHLNDFYLQGLYSDFKDWTLKDKIFRYMKDIFFYIPAGIYFAFKNFLTKKNFYLENLLINSSNNIAAMIGRTANLFKF